MDDELLVPPQQATVPDYPRWKLGYTPAKPSYVYPRGYGPPGTQGWPRLFAAAVADDGVGPSDALQQPDKPQLPKGLPTGPPPVPPVISQKWAPPQYPPPPPPPDPLAPWVLDEHNQGPWAALKPSMVKEPENFNGNSNDIARFLLSV